MHWKDVDSTDILPWPDGDAVTAAATCFTACLGARGEHGAADLARPVTGRSSIASASASQMVGIAQNEPGAAMFLASQNGTDVFARWLRGSRRIASTISRSV